MNKVRSVILLCMLWVVSCKVQAQDWHYSTFHSAPTMINPAFTGLFNGDLRIIGNYRSQWQFANAYETFSMAADGAFAVINNGDFASAGLTILADQAGDLNLPPCILLPVWPTPKHSMAMAASI